MGPTHRGPRARLTEAEQMVRDCAVAGEPADGGPGPCELTAMQAWGRDRTVRAAVLRDLLLADDSQVHEKGVHLRGLRISGQLQLEHASLRRPLRLECCYLPDGVAVTGATVSMFVMRDCQVAGLLGDRLAASLVLDFGGSTFTGPVRLMRANVAGLLNFRGCRLSNPADDGTVLWAERIRIDGDAFLDKDPGQRPFVAEGGLFLSGAVIAGNLSCVGAQLASDRGGASLRAEQIKLGGNVFLTSHPGEQGFRAQGTVNLIGADIVGVLDCSGASLGGGTGRDALIAAGAKVGISVMLGGGFSAEGAVELRGAEIAAELACVNGTQLNGVNTGGAALNARGVRVGGNLLINTGFMAAGAIFLGDSDISGDVFILGAQLGRAEAAVIRSPPPR